MGRNTCSRSLLLFAALGAVICSAGSERQPAPELVPSANVELLDAASFRHKVAQHADSKSPPYWPFVMFHVPWCEHCKHALPEFHQAADTIADAAKANQFEGFLAQPKFFTINCAAGEEKEICEKHVGQSFPSLVLFRASPTGVARSYKFDRPRLSRTIAWWVARLSRPPIYEVTSKDLLDSMSKNEPVFVLAAPDTGQDAEKVLEAWSDIALNFLDRYTFGIVTDLMVSEKIKMKSSKIKIFAPDEYRLDSLSYEGQLTDGKSMREWVELNRHPPVIQLSPYTADEAARSNMPVVTLAVSGTDSGDAKLVEDFSDTCRLLRKREGVRDYLYAVLNLTEEYSQDMMQHQWPLVADVPRVFAFAGKRKETPRYWEDASLLRPGHVTQESIKSLLNSASALQDDSMGKMATGYAKRYIRFVSSGDWFAILSFHSTYSWIPILTFLCCAQCFKALFGSGEEEEFPPKKGDATEAETKKDQ